MESLKSIVAYCLSPLVISLAVMLVGWLLLRFKKRRGGLIALGVATAMLWIGSLPVISHRPLRDLEYAHPPLEVASIGSQYATPVTVAVLGCGLNGDEQLPANSQASATFLSRFSEGVRVHKALSNSILVVSVSGDATVPQKKTFLDEMVDLFGLDPERVSMFPDAQSTADEARSVASDFASDPVVVVTSANHIPRSLREFAKAGMSPIAAPTDYATRRTDSPDDPAWKRWLPSVGGMKANHRWFYETVATIWQSIR